MFGFIVFNNCTYYNTMNYITIQMSSTDCILKIKFSEITVEEFWISIQTEFKNISEKTIKILLQISTSYLCEHRFSTLTNIKTKKT